MIVGFFIRHWKMFAIAALIAWAYSTGLSSGRTEVQHMWDLDKLEQAGEILELQAKLTRATRVLDNELHDTTERIHADADDTISSMHRGDLRLRDRFTDCPGVSAPTSTSGGDDGGGERGLSPGDQEFLIRLAERADMIAARLETCQRYVNQVTQ